MTDRQLLEQALQVLQQCREGFEFSRQFVGYEVLPAIPGWSWFDADQAAAKLIKDLNKRLNGPLYSSKEELIGETFERR